MVTRIPLTQLHGSTSTTRAVQFGTQTFAVASDSYVDGIAIFNPHLSLTTITVYNNSSNGLKYKTYGNLNENGGTQPAFDGSWTEIPKDDCEVTVATQKTRGERVVEDWAWILFRFKRATAGQNASAEVTVRSRQTRI